MERGRGGSQLVRTPTPGRLTRAGLPSCLPSAVYVVPWLSLTALGPLVPAGGPVTPTVGCGEDVGAPFPSPAPCPPAGRVVRTAHLARGPTAFRGRGRRPGPRLPPSPAPTC